MEKRISTYNQAKQFKKQSATQGAQIKLKNVTFERIDIDTLNLHDAVEVFRRTFEEEASEPINIVINDSSAELERKSKSLSLSNLPSQAALSYLADLYGVKVVYDRDLVVMRSL